MNERIQDVYPLAPGQGGILFQSLSGAMPGAYVIQIVLELSGRIDPQREAATWDALVMRHDALRTAFVWKGQKRPVQVVGRKARLSLDHVDLSAETTEAQQERYARWLAEDRAAGFDLARAPLLRVCRFTLAPGRHRIVVTFHHAILDGWSIPLLLRDWIALYDARPLPAPHPFRDHVAWVHARDHGATARFWQAELDGLSGGLWSLPSPPTPPAERRGDVSLALGTSQTRQLIQTLAPRSVTLATAVQGLWALVQSRATGQATVIHGSARAGRPAAQPATTQAVGMYLNTLPIRAQVPDDMPAIAWLRQLQARQQAQAPHEHTAMGDIQSAAGRRDGAPLIDSAVVFENYPSDPALLGQAAGLTVTSLEVLEQTSLPLALFVVLQDDALRLRLLYDAHLVDGAMVQSILADMRTGLETLARDPQVALERIEVATRVAPPAEQTTSAPPHTGADIRPLATLWQELLALPERPGANANFFDLGGHSMLVITLQDRIRSDLGHAVEIPDLFRHATLSAQAAHLQSQGTDAPQDPLQTRIETRATGRERLRQRRARTTSKEHAGHV